MLTKYLKQYRKNQGGLVVVDSGDLLNEDEKIPKSVMESVKLKAEVKAMFHDYNNRVFEL